MRMTRIHLTLVTLLGVSLLVAVLLMRESRSAAPAPPLPPAAKAPAPDPFPPDPVPQDPIDLLTVVDLRMDPVAGIWSRNGESLVTPSSPFARLQLPYLPPAEYDLRVTAERKSGEDSLNIGLSQGDRQFAVILDGGKGGDFGGLDMVDRKPFFENTTSYRKRMLPLKERRTITCSVRRGGVRVLIDDQKVIEWSGSYASLSLFGDWQVPERRGMFIGAFSSVFEIHAVVLIPFSAGGGKLRPG